MTKETQDSHVKDLSIKGHHSTSNTATHENPKSSHDGDLYMNPSNPKHKSIALKAPWDHLKNFTAARIALGRSGNAIPTSACLDFKLCHARARDAVFLPFEIDRITTELKTLQTEEKRDILSLRTAATDRKTYLRRPDLGRILSDDSTSILKSKTLAQSPQEQLDVALVIADGLSATAINQNILPFFKVLMPLLEKEGITFGPITLVENGRVAVGDEIGFLLNAKLVVIFIGERPGLNAPDSMGIYMTYAPKPGMTDERRNCISNVRPEGFPFKPAASKLIYLIKESLRRKLSGVMLKDEQPAILPR